MKIKGFDEFINESKSIDIPSLGYSRDVIKILKGLSGNGESYTEVRELEYNDDDSFDLVIQIKKTSSPDFDNDSHFKELPWEEINFKKYGFALDANTHINKTDLIIPEIIITLIINPDMEPDVYTELEYKLTDIIAHEVNHTNQIGWNRKPFKTRPSSGIDRSNANSSFKYFMLPDEIESMIIGMYERSKAEGSNLDELFDKYLLPFVEDDKLTNQEYEKVFKTWMIRALEKYPNVNLDTRNTRVSKIINSI
jgi:hypothetical protein